MDTITGKFLIRRSKMKNGKEALVITGVALPDNFPCESVKENDEVWVARLGVMDIQKYEQKSPESNGYKGSPENFLVECPNLNNEFSEWKKKS